MTDEEFTRCTNHYCRDCRKVLVEPTKDLRCHYHNNLFDKNKAKSLNNELFTTSLVINGNILDSIFQRNIGDYDEYYHGLYLYSHNEFYEYSHDALAPNHGDL